MGKQALAGWLAGVVGRAWYSIRGCLLCVAAVANSVQRFPMHRISHFLDLTQWHRAQGYLGHAFLDEAATACKCVP